MRKLTLALLLTAAPTVAIAQPQEIFWDNNGSLMRTSTMTTRISVSYQTVRFKPQGYDPSGIACIRRCSGKRKRHCRKRFRLYEVLLRHAFSRTVCRVSINGTVDVWGPAAVVDPNICRIVDYAPGSENAHRTLIGTPRRYRDPSHDRRQFAAAAEAH